MLSDFITYGRCSVPWRKWILPGAYATYTITSIWTHILTDFVCVERSKFDVAYITEFDPRIYHL